MTASLALLLLLVAAPGLHLTNAQGGESADEETAAAPDAGNARRAAGAPRKAAAEEELDYDSNFGSPDAAEVEVGGGRERVPHSTSICPHFLQPPPKNTPFPPL
jgi:hypothetical protein